MWAKHKTQSGFTIVELLIVIVVIAILATISIIAYNGVQEKAKVATLQTDLSNSSKQLKLYEAAYGSFPTALDANNCPSAPNTDANRCIVPSNGNTFTYSSDGKTFNLTEKSPNNTAYAITQSTSPEDVTLNPADWVVVGTQTWAKANLNVGTMITSTTDQTNNSNLEKHCHSNLESNCTANGGLYQWDEAMQYVTTNGARGICPAGSHIPTDTDWSTLITFLGGTATAGTQIKSGGSSGMNMPFGGFRYTDGSFYYLSSQAYLWSSTESSTDALIRVLESGNSNASSSPLAKNYSISVRCIGN